MIDCPIQFWYRSVQSIMDFPTEVIVYFLSNLSLEELFPMRLVSTNWYAIINWMITTKPSNKIHFSTLIRLIETNPNLIDQMFVNLSARDKNNVCAVYAYLGIMPKVEEYISLGAQWTPKAVGMSFCSGSKKFISKFGNANLTETIMDTLYQNYVNKRFNTKNIVGVQKTYGDKVAKWIDRHLDIYHQCEQDIVKTAVMKDNVSIIETILKNEPYPDFLYGTKKYYCTYTSLRIRKLAVEFRKMKIIKWFMNKKTSMDEEMMMYAVEYNHYDLFQLFCKKYAPTNEKLFQYLTEFSHRPLLMLSTFNRQFVDKITEIFRDERRKIIIDSSNHLVSESFCDHLDRINADNMELLRQILSFVPNYSIDIGNMAAKKNRVDIIDWLIKNGYQISVHDCSLNAVWHNNDSILECLFQFNSKQIESKWRILLCNAIIQKSKNVLYWLLEHWKEEIDPVITAKNNEWIETKQIFIGGMKREITIIKTNQKSIEIYQDFLKRIGK